MPVIKIAFALMFSLSLAFILSSCGDKNDILETTMEETTPQVILSTTVQQTTTEQATAVSENKDNISVDTYIILEDDKTVINGNGATFSKNTLSITQPGTYLFEGTLSSGKIFINTADKNKKVKLYFNGVNITCDDDAPVFIENSPKETVIILADGSVNTLTDSADRTVPADGTDYATAVIYAKDDLQIEGKGTLNIEANFNKGIFSKNDIQIRGGQINITSADDGIRGKDGVEISDGTLNITAGGDGIRTSEEEESDKGNILISGGNISVTSALDSIQSVGNLDITGGTINVTAGEGSTGNVKSDSFGDMGGMNPHDRGGKGGRGGIFDIMGSGDRKQPPDSSYNEAATESELSTKGIKAAKNISISDTGINISSLDDAIHAYEVNIKSGTFLLKSDDDGIHADNSVTIDDGKINIDFSYEGIEGKVITFNGGSTILTSTDDGLNAAGEDTDTTEANTNNMFGPGGGRGGMGGMEYASSCQIYINDGYIHMNASGDGVDSNGDVTMEDGTLIVFGPTNGGNGALDYAGTFKMNGGMLLAVGASGMAQSVSAGDGVEVLGFNCTRQANTLTVITDEKEESIIGFSVPKSYSNVIFASDSITPSNTYSVYDGGSFDSDAVNGIYTDGNYTKGNLLGTLTK